MVPPNPDVKVNSHGIPNFEDLPLRKGDPHHSAWGLYGQHDELGTLNRLTDERVAAAAREEIRTGQRVSLNWPLDAQTQTQPGQQPSRAFFQRARFHQDMFPKAPATVNDDVWTFNSQVSTQWDGLRHFGYQREKVFYNGVTMKDIHGFGREGKGKSTVNGIQGKCCFLCLWLRMRTCACNLSFADWAHVVQKQLGQSRASWDEGFWSITIAGGHRSPTATSRPMTRLSRPPSR